MHYLLDNGIYNNSDNHSLNQNSISPPHPHPYWNKEEDKNHCESILTQEISFDDLTRSIIKHGIILNFYSLYVHKLGMSGICSHQIHACHV